MLSILFRGPKHLGTNPSVWLIWTFFRNMWYVIKAECSEIFGKIFFFKLTGRVTFYINVSSMVRKKLYFNFNFRDGFSQISAKLHRVCAHETSHNTLLDMTQLLVPKSLYVWKNGDEAVCIGTRAFLSIPCQYSVHVYAWNQGLAGGFPKHIFTHLWMGCFGYARELFTQNAYTHTNNVLPTTLMNGYSYSVWPDR